MSVFVCAGPIPARNCQISFFLCIPSSVNLAFYELSKTKGLLSVLRKASSVCLYRPLDAAQSCADPVSLRISVIPKISGCDVISNPLISSILCTTCTCVHESKLLFIARECLSKIRRVGDVNIRVQNQCSVSNLNSEASRKSFCASYFMKEPSACVCVQYFV